MSPKQVLLAHLSEQLYCEPGLHTDVVLSKSVLGGRCFFRLHQSSESGNSTAAQTVLQHLNQKGKLCVGV